MWLVARLAREPSFLAKAAASRFMATRTQVIFFRTEHTKHTRYYTFAV